MPAIREIIGLRFERFKIFPIVCEPTNRRLFHIERLSTGIGCLTLRKRDNNRCRTTDTVGIMTSNMKALGTYGSCGAHVRHSIPCYLGRLATTTIPGNAAVQALNRSFARIANTLV
jgi:hypothetical protein